MDGVHDFSLPPSGECGAKQTSGRVRGDKFECPLGALVAQAAGGISWLCGACKLFPLRGVRGAAHAPGKAAGMRTGRRPPANCLPRMAHSQSR